MWRVAHATGALQAKDLERVTGGTTVQPMKLTHPTDAKLMHKAILILGGPTCAPEDAAGDPHSPADPIGERC